MGCTVQISTRKPRARRIPQWLHFKTIVLVQVTIQYHPSIQIPATITLGTIVHTNIVWYYGMVAGIVHMVPYHTIPYHTSRGTRASPSNMELCMHITREFLWYPFGSWQVLLPCKISFSINVTPRICYAPNKMSRCGAYS